MPAGCRRSSSTCPSPARCCRGSGTSGVPVAASTSHATGEDGFATAFAQPAPARSSTRSRACRSTRSERRRGGEDLPRRVVRRVVDDAVADEQLGRRRVDVAHGSECVSHESMSRTSYACRTPSVGRRHADEPDAGRIGVAGDVEHGPAVLLAEFPIAPAGWPAASAAARTASSRREDDGAGEAGVRRQRGRERGDLAVDDAERDEPVTAGRDVAEALAEEHRAPRADRRPVEELEVGDLGLGQSQQLAFWRRYSRAAVTSLSESPVAR